MSNSLSTNGKLQTENLSVGYTHNRQPQVVADGINVTLRAGELTCLIGPNGAGKSTLMRTLAGMQPPLAGHVRLGDSDLHKLPPAELAKRLAVVLTERVDVGNLSVYALVALGRHPYTDWRGHLSAQDQRIVEEALTQVRAIGLARRAVNELSDGERQRVMIARALAQLVGDGGMGGWGEGGKVLILDEPTAFLDLPRRVEMMQLLGMLARTSRRAVLLSTHDLDLALRVADRLWLLSATGDLVEGLPEELVLNGALAATFQSEGVEFDAELGSFKLHRHPCGPILVNANHLPENDIVVRWTMRALERIGYEIVGSKSVGPESIANAPDIPVTVSIDKMIDTNRYQWQVIAPSQQWQFQRLSDVIERVSNPL